MFNLQKLFGRRKAGAARVATRLSQEAKDAYLYLSRLGEDRDRTRSEIWKRGLAFGDLRVADAYTHRYQLELVHSKDRTFPQDADVVRALEELLVEKGYILFTLEVDPRGHSAILRIPDDAPSNLEGGGWSGFRGEERYDRRYFIQIEFDGSPRFTIHGPAGMQFVADLIRKFGYSLGPVTFIKESNLPLSEVVSHCIAWQDPETKKYYTEIQYVTMFVKAEEWESAQQAQVIREGPLTKVTVLGGRSMPKFQINTLEVPVRIVDEPTAHMLEARTRIKKEILERNICGVQGCGQEAVTQIHAIHFEMTDSLGGGMSSGGIVLSCAAPEHLKELQDRAGGIRQELRPIQKEVW